MPDPLRRPQVSVLGSAESGSTAYALAAEAGTLLATLGITVVSGCGSPATRVAAERAVAAGGQVLSIVPPGEMPGPDWPATVVVPCGMGDARNLLMALAGDACIVIGGRAGTISEVCLAWLHKRPLLPLVGCGGWSDGLPDHPPDERNHAPILPWRDTTTLRAQLEHLGLVPAPAATPVTAEAVVQFLHHFEAEAMKEDFALLHDMIDEHACFRFNDGDHVGRDAIRAAFEKTWRGDPTVRKARFWLSDIAVQSVDVASASATYTWHWEGSQGERSFAVQGRGTRVLRFDGGRFRIVHEHLSRFPPRQPA